MRWEGERLGLSAGLKGEDTAGSDVPFATPAPPKENSGGRPPPSAFINWDPLACLSKAATANSSGSVGAGTSCLGDLCSDVTVFTRLCPTWGCLHLRFHHVKDAALLLLSTGRAAVCPHKGGV